MEVFLYIFETQLTEVMTYSMPEKQGDYIFSFIREKLNRFDVILFGPGIGTGKKAVNLLNNILNFWNKPLVIDADGLNILAQNPQIMKKIKNKNILLTPHLGEFARLTKIPVEKLSMNRVEILHNFQKKYNIDILLKSATTMLVKDNEIYLDISGNDGLSTGGSGDVLSGIITSFIAQKLPVDQAAVSASFLMGKTAEKLEKIRETASIIPSDIIENMLKKQ